MHQPHDPHTAQTSQGSQSTSDFEPIELADDTPSPVFDHGPGVIDTEQHCITCGYLIRGLDPAGVCPECGTSLEESLRGDLLFFRNIEYVRTLRRGLSFILNGILLYIISYMGMVAVTIIVGMGGGAGVLGPGTAELLFAAGQLGVSILILVGWWMFTSQDPGVPTETEPKARKVTRIAVAVNAITALLGFGIQGLFALGIVDIVVVLLSAVIGIAGIAAFVTQFFAGMLYVRGLARRLPSEKIYKLAKSRMIACPIWSTVGMLLFGIGVLIALILYWNLLDMVRKALKTIITAIENGESQPPTIIVKR